MLTNPLRDAELTKQVGTDQTVCIDEKLIENNTGKVFLRG